MRAHSDHDRVWKSLPWPGLRDRGTLRQRHPATGSWHFIVHVDTWDSACEDFRNTQKKYYLWLIKYKGFFSSALIANTQLLCCHKNLIYWNSELFHTLFSFDLTFLFLLSCILWCQWPPTIIAWGKRAWQWPSVRSEKCTIRGYRDSL